MTITMKQSILKNAAFRFSFVAALALAPFLAGCAGEDEDLNANYPQTSAATIGSSDQEPVGIAPGPATNSIAAQQAADEAYARGYAAGQSGDSPDPQLVTGGAEGDQGSLAVGDDGTQYSDSDPSALTDFRTTLDPYGTWVEDPQYGTIWVPSTSVVGSDFTPYVSAGHWVYDNDYVWVSDYDWGWAPFHYGRWIQTGNAWGWIPGRAYSGAWVTWRTGYDGYGYVGWAPLSPSWYWRGGYAYGLYSVPPSYYTYCPNNRIFTPGFGGSAVGGAAAASMAARTRPYVAAAPSANGGRIGANPTVNGAVASRGPAPQSLGYSGAQIPHSNASNVGLARAQGFARPQSAQAFGAHAPASINGGYSRGTVSTHSSLAPIATGPRYIGNTNGGPSRVNYPTRPTTSYSRPSSFSSQPSYERPSSSFQGHSFSGPRPSPFTSRSSSGFTPHSSFSSGSSYHSSPSFSSPSFHAAAPSYHPSSHPSYGGGGGHGRR
jgi:hypothetical protein